MPRTIQPSFASGELSPSLHARIDLDQFRAGLSSCKNMFIKVYGGAANRPGTRLVAAVKTHNRRPRLIPFQFSTSQSYVLELGHLYIRVHKDGAPVLYPDGHADEGEPVEIASPYGEGDLPLLKFAQSADVMFLVHPWHEPRTLSRADHHAWTLATIDFATGVPTPTAGQWSLGTIGDGDYDGDGDGIAEPFVDWKYRVTYENEKGEESLPSAVKTAQWPEILSPRDAVRITINEPLPAGVKRANVYKLRAGVYGWIGSTDSGDVIDDGRVADLSETPPEQHNPFDAPGKYPGAVGFFQQRLALGGSDDEPDTLHLSRIGHYRNFRRSEPTRDDDAITATLSSLQVNQIRHLVGMRALLILTSGGVWSLKRGDRGLTPSLEGGLDLEAGLGASQVPPLIVGSSCLFVQDKGRVVRDLTYDVASDAYHGEEISLLAEHLLRGEDVIVEWAYAAQPFSVIWAVRDDGWLLSLSYHREQRVFGWARHQTDGHFESVCTVSEGGEDAVYVVVRRLVGGTWKRFVERFASRLFRSIKDAFFLDCGLSYDEPRPIEWMTQGASIVVTCPGHGLANGDLVDIEDVEGMDGVSGRRFIAQVIDADAIEIYEQHRRDAEGGLVPAAGQTPYVAGGVLRKAATVLSGLDHLNGRSVMVLADGNVEGPHVVANGAITLLHPASRAHVGLPYEAELVTLPLPLEPEPFGRKKRVTQVQLHVDAARGVVAGPVGGPLDEYKQRSDEDWGAPTRLKSGMLELSVPAAWSDDGKVMVRQKDCLPIEVLAISPIFEVGG